jgi:hypothetical protein
LGFQLGGKLLGFRLGGKLLGFRQSLCRRLCL